MEQAVNCEANSTASRSVEIIRGLGLGGAETLLYLRLRRHGQSTQSGEDTPIVINTAPTEDFYTSQLRRAGIEIRNVASSNSLIGGIDVVQKCRKLENLRVIIVHSPGPALFLKAARLLRLLDAPVVQVVHHARYRLIYRWLGRVTNWIAAGAVAVSDEVKRSESCRGFRRVRTVYGGVDTVAMAAFLEEHPQLRTQIRQSLRVPEGLPMICSVGTLLARKGHSDLLEAFVLADTDAHLVIVGDGPERRSLEAQIERLGVQNRVHLLGRVSPGWHWIAASDAMCHTAHAEGFPVVLMEALALGVPVIATKFSGATEAMAIEPALVALVPVGDAAAIATRIGRVRHNEPAWAATTQRMRSSYWSVNRFDEEFENSMQTISPAS